MRVFCLDESIRRTSELPPGYRWSQAVDSQDSEGLPCAVILRDAADLPRLEGVLGQAVANVLPLIGLSDDLRTRVDLTIGAAIPTIGGALLTLQSEMQRAARLPSILKDVTERSAWLLAHLAVRDTALAPAYDPGSPSVARFLLEDRLGDWVGYEAERLSSWRLLEGRFAEQMNICPDCSSGRLLVREECPSCRSSQVADEGIIHHFRCAEQAPESHFRQGSDLVCPKCRQYLRHFSVDYDKPAVTLICRACNHHTGDPAIGFRCLDCGRHDAAERLLTREVKSYTLTQLGQNNAFDAAWLGRFCAPRDNPGSFEGREVTAPATAAHGQSLLQFRLVQPSATGWSWLRPGARSQAQDRSKGLAQRLVQEHFSADRLEFSDAAHGFDARIERAHDDIVSELPKLEKRLRELIAAPHLYEVSAAPWPSQLSRASR